MKVIWNNEREHCLPVDHGKNDVVTTVAVDEAAAHYPAHPGPAATLQSVQQGTHKLYGENA